MKSELEYSYPEAKSMIDLLFTARWETIQRFCWKLHFHKKSENIVALSYNDADENLANIKRNTTF